MKRLKINTDQRVFFTSDTHAYHKHIIKFCPNSRWGKDEEHMTEIMIQQWNNQVQPDDIVFHLGDVSFGNQQQTKNYVNRLNGKIHLILGNHDKEYVMRSFNRFETIKHYDEILVQGLNWVLCHYPIFEWNMLHRGAVHLYGHVHGRKLAIPEGRSMDVGVDTRADMGLYSLKEVLSIVNSKPIRDHHGREGEKDPT